VHVTVVVGFGICAIAHQSSDKQGHRFWQSSMRATWHVMIFHPLNSGQQSLA
jgi:hypothetical protein